jgi:dimethylargininase
LRALVRPPGESYTNALSQGPRPPIDVTLARERHAGYCEALRAAGFDLIELPADEEHPDACFVQDTAVIFGGLAVLTRFAAPSRQGEQDAVSRALRGHKRLEEVRSPATLEGGDVLMAGSHVFVGLSPRTNRAGFARLRHLLEVEGATVEALPVSEGLHLMTGCSYVGRGVLLATGTYADVPAFAGLELVRVPPEEAYAANALAVGDTVVLPAGHPRTATRLHALGFDVLTVSLSEFAKADGGVTCLALPF